MVQASFLMAGSQLPTNWGFQFNQLSLELEAWKSFSFETTIPAGGWVGDWIKQN